MLADDPAEWLPYSLTPGWHDPDVPEEEEEVAVALPAVADALQIVDAEIEVAEPARPGRPHRSHSRQAFPVPFVHHHHMAQVP